MKVFIGVHLWRCVLSVMITSIRVTHLLPVLNLVGTDITGSFLIIMLREEGCDAVVARTHMSTVKQQGRLRPDSSWS